MRRLNRAAVLPTVAIAAALGLSACQGEDAPPTQPTDAPTSQAAPQGQGSSPEATSEPAETASPSTSEGGSSASAVPESEREDANDKSSIPAERGTIPDGPVTFISIKTLGGYETESEQHGRFYAALSVDSTEPGLVSLEYVMLDRSGKEIGTAKDSLRVGGTKGEIKVTNAIGKLPSASEGKVAKVQLRVTENSANQFATVSTVEPKFTYSTDPDSATPIVQGRYKVTGKSSIGGMTAICRDAQGRVVTGNSPVDDPKATSWTKFEVSLFDAPKGYKPSKCYVGS